MLTTFSAILKTFSNKALPKKLDLNMTVNRAKSFTVQHISMNNHITSNLFLDPLRQQFYASLYLTRHTFVPYNFGYSQQMR